MYSLQPRVSVCCASVIMSPCHLIRNVPFAETSAEEGGVGQDIDERAGAETD
jgi:hypothetical protein